MRELARGARFTLRTRAPVSIGNVTIETSQGRPHKCDGCACADRCGPSLYENLSTTHRWHRRARAIAALARVSRRESDARAQKERGDLRAVPARCRPARKGRAGTASEY